MNPHQLIQGIRAGAAGLEPSCRVGTGHCSTWCLGAASRRDPQVEHSSLGQCTAGLDDKIVILGFQISRFVNLLLVILVL